MKSASSVCCCFRFSRFFVRYYDKTSKKLFMSELDSLILSLVDWMAGVCKKSTGLPVAGLSFGLGLGLGYVGSWSFYTCLALGHCISLDSSQGSMWLWSASLQTSLGNSGWCRRFWMALAVWLVPYALGGSKRVWIINALVTAAHGPDIGTSANVQTHQAH